MRTRGLLALIAIWLIATLSVQTVHAQLPGGPAAPGAAPAETALAAGAQANLPPPLPAQLHLAGSVNLRTLPVAGRAAGAAPRAVPLRPTYGTAASIAASRAAAAGSANVPVTAGATLVGGGPSGFLPPPGGGGFEGVAGSDSGAVNGSDLTPPDQGLCTDGTDIVELINDAGAVYTPTGTRLAGYFANSAFFAEPVAEFLSDPRCQYDPTTHSWFATILAIDADNAHSHLDIAVNPTQDPTTSWTIYRIDTTNSSGTNCPCFGDQPLLGLDAYGVFISVNEFPIVGSFPANGAIIYAISKGQMEMLLPTPSIWSWSYPSVNLCQGGCPTPILSIQPAVTRETSPAEYFLASFDPRGTVDRTLWVGAITNEAALSGSPGTPILSFTSVSGQLYGVPPLAAEAGNGNLLGNLYDDRMMQVQNLNGTLYAALGTVLHVNGDPPGVNRAGVAWYNVVPALKYGVTILTAASISAQGYVGVQGAYLIYPAIAATDPGGTMSMAMTLAGPGVDGPPYFPSAVWSTATGSPPEFLTASIAAAGTGGANNFDCSPCRWGDYSAATPVMGTSTIWMATEYIGTKSDSDVNYSTRVFPNSSFVPGTPGAPGKVLAVAGNGSATVTWAPPANTGTSPISSYIVSAAPGGTCSTAGALTCTVNGLTNGLTYTFTVTATNASGTGPPSQTSNPIVPAAAVPGAPVGVSAVGGNASAIVTWASPANSGGGPITGYTVIGAPGGACSTSVALTCTVNGLTNGLAYTFTVAATNASGTGPPSQPSKPVVPSAGPPLGAMSISGSTTDVPPALRTVAANVGGTPCASISQVKTATFQLSLPASCGVAGQAVTFTVGGSPAGLQTSGGAICLQFAPGASISGLTVIPGGTPNTSCATAQAPGPAGARADAPSLEVLDRLTPGLGRLLHGLMGRR